MSLPHIHESYLTSQAHVGLRSRSMSDSICGKHHLVCIFPPNPLITGNLDFDDSLEYIVTYFISDKLVENSSPTIDQHEHHQQLYELRQTLKLRILNDWLSEKGYFVLGKFRTEKSALELSKSLIAARVPSQIMHESDVHNSYFHNLLVHDQSFHEHEVKADMESRAFEQNEVDSEIICDKNYFDFFSAIESLIDDNNEVQWLCPLCQSSNNGHKYCNSCGEIERNIALISDFINDDIFIAISELLNASMELKIAPHTVSIGRESKDSSSHMHDDDEILVNREDNPMWFTWNSQVSQFLSNKLFAFLETYDIKFKDFVSALLYEIGSGKLSVDFNSLFIANDHSFQMIKILKAKINANFPKIDIILDREIRHIHADGKSKHSGDYCCKLSNKHSDDFYDFKDLHLNWICYNCNRRNQSNRYSDDKENHDSHVDMGPIDSLLCPNCHGFVLATRLHQTYAKPFFDNICQILFDFCDIITMPANNIHNGHYHESSSSALQTKVDALLRRGHRLSLTSTANILEYCGWRVKRFLVDLIREIAVHLDLDCQVHHHDEIILEVCSGLHRQSDDVNSHLMIASMVHDINQMFQNKLILDLKD